MANDWFSAFTAFISFGLARASDLNTLGNALVSGFDKLPFKRPLNEDRTTFATDSGVANAYVLTLSNVQTAQRPTDYQPGFRVSFAPAYANTGACTVNVYNPNGVLIGAANITLDGSTAPAAGALAPPKLVTLEYDGTTFQIVSGGISVTGGLSINSGVKVDGTDTTFGTLTQKLTVTAAGGISKTVNNGGANEDLGLALDVNGMAASTNVVATDTFPVYDATAAAMKKQTRANLVGKYGLILQAAKVAGFTAVAGNLYICDTTAGAFTVALPAAATVGDVIAIVLGGVNVLTLNPNGLNLNGSTNTFNLISEQTLLLTYHSIARGWV